MAEHSTTSERSERQEQPKQPPRSETAKPATAENMDVEITQARAGIPPDQILTNDEVQRGFAVTERFTDEQKEAFEDGAAMARAETLAQTGKLPDQLDHHVNIAPPVGADQPAPKGGFYGISGTYILGQRDIFASDAGMAITSYTLDAAGVSADANGDKIVQEGTVLQASTNAGKAIPRTTGTAIGITASRVNLRYADSDVGMIVGGRVRSDKCWDNGTFGSIAAGAITTLNGMGIYFTTYDL